MLPMTLKAIDNAWKQKGMFKDELDDLKDIESNMLQTGKYTLNSTNNTNNSYNND